MTSIGERSNKLCSNLRERQRNILRYNKINQIDDKGAKIGDLNSNESSEYQSNHVAYSSDNTCSNIFSNIFFKNDRKNSS